MPSTTEICTLTLVAGSDINDSNSPTAKVFKECCDTIASQDGFQRLWYGTEEEDPGVLQLFIDWDGKASHEKFSDSDAYKPFRERLAVIHTGVPNVVHVDFRPEGGVEEALRAPVFQVATFYYEEAPPTTAFEGAKTLIEAMQRHLVNIMGWAYGTTHEVLEKDGECIKGRGNMFLVGWESINAHNESWNTQALKDNIHRLTTPEVKGIAMHHVRATKYERSEKR